MKCTYGKCTRDAKYYMGWIDAAGKKHCGMVCAKHDRELGRKNLVSYANMTMEQAVAFDQAGKEE